MKNRLRVARAEKDVTQYQVAATLHIGRDRYWRIENEWTEPTPEECNRLARYFKVPATDLFPELLDAKTA